jgi:hypothetical protein
VFTAQEKFFAYREKNFGPTLVAIERQRMMVESVMS